MPTILKTICLYILKAILFVGEIGAFYYFTYLESYFVRMERKTGTSAQLAILIIYAVYVIINHLLIKRFISVRVLRLFEILIFVNLIAIPLTYRYYQYLWALAH